MTLDAATLSTVTGGGEKMNKVGNWLVQRGYDLSEGTEMFKALQGVSEVPPANKATFAKYNALREMHGRPPRANLGNP